jgi:hypothetical protein
MKKQTVYVDTSVIGGCFDDEFKEWSNNLVTDFQKGLFIPVLSEITAAEINEAPFEVKTTYQEILSYNSLYLEIDDSTIALAEYYQKRNVLTEKFFDDGLHIALATINRIDMLVSWNFKHIVHFDKIRLFNSINIEIGYKPIEIYSPREVAIIEND